MDKRKIKKIISGEKVIVQIISEDLQDLYSKMRDSFDEYSEAENEMVKDKTNPKKARAVFVAQKAYQDDKFKFWAAVNDRYGLWLKNVGIRDGFALVEIPSKQIPSERIWRDIWG